MQRSEHLTHLCNHRNHTSYFVPGGCLKLARKDKHKQPQKGWKKDKKVPQAQTGLGGVGWSTPSGTGIFRTVTGAKETHLVCLLRPAGYWDLLTSRPWIDMLFPGLG